MSATRVPASSSISWCSRLPVGPAAPLREAAILAFAASWGKCRLHGRALLGAAYGESAGLPAVLAVVLDTLVLQSLTILLLESGGCRAWRPAYGRPAVVRNPLIIAVFAGAVVAGLGLALAGAVVGFLTLLGPAAAAGALFALGATLRGGALAEFSAWSARPRGQALLLLLLLWVCCSCRSRRPAGAAAGHHRPADAASVFVIAQRRRARAPGCRHRLGQPSAGDRHAHRIARPPGRLTARAEHALGAIPGRGQTGALGEADLAE